MMNDQYVIFVGDDGWRVGVAHDGEARVSHVPTAEDATLEARVNAVRQQLADMGYTDQPVVLALASSWCLCATISTDELERGGRRRAMGFRLEEHLPISTEEFIADYLDAGNSEALGVCGELEKLRSLVNAIEAAGIGVRHVCPVAFLTAACAVDRHAELGGVLIGGKNYEGDSGVGYDLIELHKGKPTHWWWLADDETAVRDRLAAWATSSDQPMRLALIGCGESIFVEIQARKWLQHIELGEISGDQAAAIHAAKISDGAASSWIDLRHDALAAPNQYQAYRKPIGALVATMVLLLICASAVSQWRGRQYEALNDQYVQQQVDVFKAALPDQRVPGSITARLLSERRKLAGLAGEDSGDADAEAMKSTSALMHLREVLGRLPRDARYRILDLNIQPDLIRVDGEARTHAEAERLAVALRQSGVYEVEPPRTQALKEGGVSFLFTARPQTDSTTLKVSRR